MLPLGQSGYLSVPGAADHLRRVTPLPASSAPATTSAPASPTSSSAAPDSPTLSANDAAAASESPLQPEPVASTSNGAGTPVLAVGGAVLIAAAATIATMPGAAARGGVGPVGEARDE